MVIPFDEGGRGRFDWGEGRITLKVCKVAGTVCLLSWMVVTKVYILLSLCAQTLSHIQLFVAAWTPSSSVLRSLLARIREWGAINFKLCDLLNLYNNDH